jgi:hypothetical protein
MLVATIARISANNEITSKGVVIMGHRLTDYQGLITGIPEHLNRSGNHEERLHKPKGEAGRRCLCIEAG